MMDDYQSSTFLRKATDRVRRICEDLLHAAQIDAALVSAESVPAVYGIYMWRFKKDGSPAYIGVGLGKKGLQQRIVKQHLCASYTKSVFRKAIMQAAGVGPRQESVDFIRLHFTLGTVICSENPPAVIEAAEALMIAALSPKYNKKWGNCQQQDAA